MNISLFGSFGINAKESCNCPSYVVVGETAKIYIKNESTPGIFTGGMFWQTKIIAKLYWGHVLAMIFVRQNISAIVVRGGICLPITPTSSSLVLASSVDSPPSRRFDHRNRISCTYTFP